jgi:hypothetical protein
MDNLVQRDEWIMLNAFMNPTSWIIVIHLSLVKYNFIQKKILAKSLLKIYNYV